MTTYLRIVWVNNNELIIMDYDNISDAEFRIKHLRKCGTDYRIMPYVEK
jgi:hypothetical protein